MDRGPDDAYKRVILAFRREKREDGAIKVPCVVNEIVNDTRNPRDRIAVISEAFVLLHD